MIQYVMHIYEYHPLRNCYCSHALVLRIILSFIAAQVLGHLLTVPY